MRTITSRELKEILEKHRKWNYSEEGGERADLSNADLSGANLFGADLSGADLSCASLFGADLRYADLSYTDLSYADLSYADLSNADLSCASLFGADLSYASLRRAILDESEQCRKGIILKEPREAYKRCGKYIVKLLIPNDAIVFSINNNICRTNKAYVMAILNLDETIANTLSVASDYDRDFVYKVGKLLEIRDFDMMYNVERSTGIHFFWSFEKARDYK